MTTVTGDLGPRLVGGEFAKDPHYNCWVLIDRDGRICGSHGERAARDRGLDIRQSHFGLSEG